jgi:hypothetical protein
MAGLKVIIVEWLDSCGHNAWLPLDEVAASLVPANCRSIGVPIAKTDTYITLASGFDLDNHNINQAITIPMACVKSVTELKMPKGYPKRRKSGKNR